MLKKLCILFLTIILVVGIGSTAGATLMFEDTVAGGVGSAEWDLVDVDGVSWEIKIYNTSPTTLIGDIGINSPGITGLGFDLEQGDLGISSWSLQADDSGGTLLTIGGSGSSTGDWALGAGSGDVVLDFNASTTSGSSGALYNPLAISGFGGPPHYFTEAILSITWDSDASLIAESAFVRMQNVALDGDGSLKMNPVPEPATMFLLGTGLISLAGFGRKRFFKN